MTTKPIPTTPYDQDIKRVWATDKLLWECLNYRAQGYRRGYRRGLADAGAKYAGLVGLAQSLDRNSLAIRQAVKFSPFSREIIDLFALLSAALAGLKGAEQ